MGEKDSTLTRVVPLMKFLNKDISKINRLLQLFEKKVSIDSGIIGYYYGKKTNGDPGELSIPAKAELLEWYILHPENLDKTQNIQKNGSPKEATIIARNEFFNGNKNRQEEALSAIKKLKSKKKQTYKREWYFFEGYTNPDIFIETDSVILIGEAKRTESHLTNEVRWYKDRDQLIRHVDSIIGTQRAKNKKIYSFFILDERNKGTLQDVKDYPKAKVLKDSLPHLKDEERLDIKNTYLGYTTWEKISSEFGITFED